MRIGTNTIALSAIRGLSNINRALSRALERLSTGKRINSARDDAAGLAISTSLDSQKRALAQGVRNINDGVSLIHTADGSLSTMTELIQRMRELAIQSANGLLSSADRQSLQSEFSSLLQEFDREADSTSVGNLKLFDGSLQTQLQVGSRKSESIDFAISSVRADNVFTKAFGTGSFGASTTFYGGGYGGLDFNGDGKIDLVSDNSVSFGNGDGTFKAAKTSAGVPDLDRDFADFNGDGILDMIYAHINTTSPIQIRFGNSDGSFGASKTAASSAAPVMVKAADFNNDGNQDILSWTATTDEMEIYLGHGDGTFETAIHYVSPLDLSNTASNLIDNLFAFRKNQFMDVGDANGDGVLDILHFNGAGDGINIERGDGQGNFSNMISIPVSLVGASLMFKDMNGDGKDDVVTTDSLGTTLSVYLSNGNGTFGSEIQTALPSDAREISAGDLNNDGKMDLILGPLSGSANLVLMGNGNGTFRIRGSFQDSNGFSGVADFNNDGVLDFSSFGGIRLASTYEDSALGSLNILSQSSAQDSLSILDGALRAVVSQRAGLGALENSLESALNSNGTAIENLSSALSNIQDADVAEETANLTRAQILQQAGVSVLAQANLQMRMVLDLLKF